MSNAGSGVCAAPAPITKRAELHSEGTASRSAIAVSTEK
nr:MAG TPA: hypothetical protein [Caudoviricetes sp.]